MEDNLLWKMIFDGRQLLKEDYLRQETTFDKTTIFNGRQRRLRDLRDMKTQTIFGPTKSFRLKQIFGTKILSAQNSFSDLNFFGTKHFFRTYIFFTLNFLDLNFFRTQHLFSSSKFLSEAKCLSEAKFLSDPS